MKHVVLGKIDPVDLLRYYVTYKDIEEGILTNIDSSVQKEREAAYNEYVNKHMKIGRNFRANTGN
jgi:hypothetical protein